jgi:TolB-like protein
MPDIFLSYAREDQATARMFAVGLERDGFSVWWDQTLHTGEAYDKVTEAALREARAVVVLWSKTSVDSRWVRAEATTADRLGTLMPVMIEPCVRPIMFELTHTAELMHWRGDGRDAAWLAFVEDVRRYVRRRDTDSQAAAPARHGSSTAWRYWKRQRVVQVAVAVLAVASLAGTMLLVRRDHSRAADAGVAASSVEPVRVAVLPFDVLSDSSDLRHFAAGLTDEIISTLSSNQLQTISREDSVTLRGAGRNAALARIGASLLFDGTVQQDGDDIHVRVHLDSPTDHVTLWSSDFRRSSRDSPTLQTEIAARAGGLIQLALFARSPGAASLDNEALAMALTLDDKLRYSDSRDTRVSDQAVAIGRKLVGKVPRFAWGHSSLANALQWNASTASPGDADKLLREAKSQAELALELDPKDAMAYFALSALELGNSARRYEAVILKGLSIEPHPAIFVGGLNGREAQLLHHVGRLREALTYWKRAVALDPLSAWEHSGLATTLGMLGDATAAHGVISEALARWPNDSGVLATNFDELVLRGAPREALALLDDPAALPPGLTAETAGVYRAFVQARQAPDRATKARALDAIGSAFRSGLIGADPVVAMYAQLGDIDAAFDAAGKSGPGLAGRLFGPATAGMRADRRFMTLAARLGLVDYWQATGNWPDFCAAPNAPYDCKAAAARFAAAAAGVSR